MVEWINESRKNFKIVWENEFSARVTRYGLLLSPQLAKELGQSVTFGHDEQKDIFIIKPVSKNYAGCFKVTKISGTKDAIKSIKAANWIQARKIRMNIIYNFTFNESKQHFESKIGEE